MKLPGRTCGAAATLLLAVVVSAPVLAGVEVRAASDWIERGTRHYLAGRPGEAAVAYEKAAVADPNMADCRFHLGVALEASGKPGEAAEAFEQAIKIDPTHTDSLFSLATIQADSGRIFSARRHLLKALKLKPNDATIHHALGMMFLASDQPKAATRSFEMALHKNPRHPAAQLGLSRALHQMGNPPRARALREKALSRMSEVSRLKFEARLLRWKAGTVGASASARTEEPQAKSGRVIQVQKPGAAAVRTRKTKAKAAQKGGAPAVLAADGESAPAAASKADARPVKSRVTVPSITRLGPIESAVARKPKSFPVEPVDRPIPALGWLGPEPKRSLAAMTPPFPRKLPGLRQPVDQKTSVSQGEAIASAPKGTPSGAIVSALASTMLPGAESRVSLSKVDWLNQIALEAVTREENRLALVLLTRAYELSPESAWLANNLAVVQSHLGYGVAAEVMFQSAAALEGEGSREAGVNGKILESTSGFGLRITRAGKLLSLGRI